MSDNPRWTRTQSFGWVVVAYVVALVAAWLTVRALPEMRPLWAALIADVVATLVVFAFSRVFSCSSIYDPYWSVAPIALVTFWLFYPEVDPHPVRAGLVVFLVCWWGLRLTWNWARGWPGLHHEDWRYVEMQQKSGKLYPLADLFGIQLFPTFQVFAGCIGAWAALSLSARALGPLDALAAIVTAGAIIIETVADQQLRAFSKVKEPGQILDHGLWAFSRHPNYFGEVGFWWGLALFGIAAVPSAWWVFIGPVAITAMFLGVSIPWLDRRSAERRPAYAEHMKRVSGFVPWFPKGSH